MMFVLSKFHDTHRIGRQRDALATDERTLHFKVLFLRLSLEAYNL